MPVQVGIRCSAHYLLAPSRESLFFLLGHPAQDSLSASIPGECALDRSCDGSIYLNRLFFDVVVRFVVTICSEALDGLMIHSSVSRLLVGLRRSSRIRVGSVRFGCLGPGLW